MPVLSALFDPVNGFFNIHFWLGGIASLMIGFGLVYLSWSSKQYIEGKSYFWHTFLSLITFIAGLSVFVSLG